MNCDYSRTPIKNKDLSPSKDYLPINDLIKDVIDSESEEFLLLDDTTPHDFISGYKIDFARLKRELLFYADSIGINKEQTYIKKRDNYKFQFCSFNGFNYFLRKLFYIFKNKHKFNLTEEEIINLKELFYKEKRTVEYFRLNHKEYNKINNKNKRIIDNALFLKTKNHYYFFLSDYIYEDLIYNLDDIDLIGKITNFYLANLRRASGLNKNILIREKNKNKRINHLIKRIEKIKKENENINVFDGVKFIESEINKLLSFKINISKNMNSVVILDKESNYILKYFIQKSTFLDFRASGMCDYRSKKITILDGMSNVQFITVLFHEIGHMYDYFINYEIRDDCKFIKCRREEFSNIETEKISIMFEKMAKGILKTKYESVLYKENNQTIIDTQNLIFKLINGKFNDKIQFKDSIHEMYFYSYYIFRKLNQYNDFELENSIDMYTYGHIESEKTLRKLNFNC